jgi:glycosyltransferase involved in cell wall biosynthesis
MWPLIKRLRCDPEIEKIPLIYSSQNWEAPLKYAMLVRTGTTPSIAHTVEQMIEDIEREAVHASQLIFAVSDADANIYREIDPGKRIIVVRNGVDRPGQTSEAAQAEDTLGGLRDRRYLFFVGSAYPPNVDGMCDLLLEDGLFFMPPRRGLAICGGSAQGIFDDPRYQRFLGANTERVSFYPSISDANLETLKSSAHAILLPINFGGGSNLKTAEALASGKWVVATPTAMRGFENYISEPGVVIAEGRAAFRKAVITVFNSPPLQLTDEERARRDMVYWDHCFDHVTLQDLNLNKPASIAPIG